MPKKKLVKQKSKLLDIIMLLILLIGVLALMYPFVSDSLNRYLDQKLIERYQVKANAENQKAFLATKEKMAKKNQEIAEHGGSPGADPFSVKNMNEPIIKQLDYYERHTIGIIHIPKIKQSLPIFDGSSSIFLEQGVGLLEGTSYPTGGPNTHATLTAHRGLPEAKLFTDLPKLANGDQFYIEINGETLAYEVYNEQVIEPTETDSLLVQEGKDIVTLLTCTPYMVNSHRLLVTGKRVPYIAEKSSKKIAEVSFWNRYSIYIWLGIIIVVILLISTFIYKKYVKQPKY